jgi:deoxyribodipyrimidine photolyase
VFISIPFATSYTRHIDERYDKSQLWNTVPDPLLWKKFINGQTGHKLIDNAIHELTTTGYTHGRNRILLGYYWVHVLLISPLNLRFGSQSFFSRYLIDSFGSFNNKMNNQWLTEFDFSGKRFNREKNKLPIGRPMKYDNSVIKKYILN